MCEKWLKMLGFGAVSLILLAGSGCNNSAVGAPCSPEQVQPGGFLASETYLETSSVQCATRVCLVRELQGDPNNLIEDGCPRGEETCVSACEAEQKVYCSCRCGAPAGSGVPTCSCPDGFFCEEVLETGGNGVRGSYCVRSELAVCE